MSAGDDLLIAELRAGHVGGLREFIIGDIPNVKEGIILVFCGDGHRSPEAVRRVLSELSNFGESVSLHKLADNGQPLLLHPTIINGRPGRKGSGIDAHFLESIDDAIGLGKGKTVFLLGHWPCGLAAACELTLPTYLRALCETKLIVREAFASRPGITVLTGLHAHRPCGMKTYFLSRTHTIAHLDSVRLPTL